MQYFTRLSALALLTAIGLALPAISRAASPVSPHNTANTIRLEPDHPDSFRHFAPELPKMLARVPPLDPDTGLYVGEIEPGLYFVTDHIYQSAFLVTKDGIVVFDAPPSFAERLRPVIEATAPGVPITHLIMSHGHTDHVGGTIVFADLPDLTVIAADKVAQSLASRQHPNILQPTKTFDDSLDLSIGGVPIALKTTNFHAEDQDVMIYLPDQEFLMAIDTITPGEVPFMNFGATTDVGAYFAMFDTVLAYDFKHFLSGHVSVPGTREDVVIARDYAFDVRNRVQQGMAGFQDRFLQAFTLFDFKNGNLAYRQAIESVRDECAAGLIDTWKDELSAVDVWADSHCEYTVLYYVMH